MGKAIGAAILCYVVLAAFIMATFTLAYLAMGADRAFQPGSYDPSTLWLAVSTLLGATGAVLAGVIAARVGRGTRAPQVLALLVLVVGILLALPALMAPPAAAEMRTGDVSNLEAMKKARQPTWISLLNPVIGAAGVMAGASLRGGARGKGS